MEECSQVEEGTWIPNASMTDACAAGDVRSIAHLLHNGVTVNDVLNNGRTPLFIASESGHVEAVRALVSHGAAVNRSFVVRRCCCRAGACSDAKQPHGKGSAI